MAKCWNVRTDNPLASLPSQCITLAGANLKKEADMSLYCGIDLHSNNHVIVVIDGNDKKLIE
ncbi:MAG: hypothetical protein ACE5EH_07175 [Gammaproteobacteria bacterium]